MRLDGKRARLVVDGSVGGLIATGETRAQLRVKGSPPAVFCVPRGLPHCARCEYRGMYSYQWWHVESYPPGLYCSYREGVGGLMWIMIITRRLDVMNAAREFARQASDSGTKISTQSPGPSSA